jgi:coproporphyrinogen III oxidase
MALLRYQPQHVGDKNTNKNTNKNNNKPVVVTFVPVKLLVVALVLFLTLSASSPSSTVLVDAFASPPTTSAPTTTWSSFRIPHGSSSSSRRFATEDASGTTVGSVGTESAAVPASSPSPLAFDDFVEFLLAQQTAIISEIEGSIERTSGATFSRDPWGVFALHDDPLLPNRSSDNKSGGITRVLQGGAVIEKGACSVTLIRDGVLTAERASTIQGRQRQRQQQQEQQQSTNDDDDDDDDSLPMIVLRAGDTYSAAALSMVLHSRNPHVPTFRSDVRVFLVTPQQQPQDATAAAAGGSTTSSSRSRSSSCAWLGGGADLTPYYLIPDDIRDFHGMYQELCARHVHALPEPFSFATMKAACDAYFYLPARQEHRGTGGIFFDDLPADTDTLAFCRGVAETWMPSWLPIATQRGTLPYTEQQKQWQKLRRGRYLEFNLLYDVRSILFSLFWLAALGTDSQCAARRV